MRARVERTATSAFGSGRREGHDSSGFYGRFEAPELTTDDTVTPLAGLRQGEAACIVGDARAMTLPDGARLPDASVALVVTSPPYFVGKEYEQALGEGAVPTTYLEYLDLLTEVFAECKRVLEPGGRIAVNVANLGRKPYRSLAADVIGILQDRLHLLLRGEVVWRKAEGASGSCAWGSYRSAANPVLRDVTERVVIASKGRFDRARTRTERRRLGLPHENDVTADEFLAATLDVWDIPPESAKRVQHPAPFPVELPQRLIGLYTYVGDVVVDPFMGSGTSLVAAARTGRRYLGYDLDPGYTATARARVREELRRRSGLQVVGQPSVDEEANVPAPRDGRGVTVLAEELLEGAGFRIDRRNARQRGLGLTVSFEALDAAGRGWYVDVVGAFTTTGGGLQRTETVWRTLGRASVLAARSSNPLLVVTSHLPRPGSEGDQALRAAGPGVVFDVVDLRSAADRRRLEHYARGGADRAMPGWWTEAETARATSAPPPGATGRGAGRTPR